MLDLVGFLVGVFAGFWFNCAVETGLKNAVKKINPQV